MCNKYNSSEQRPAFEIGEARELFTRTEKFGECGDVVLKSGSRVKNTGKSKTFLYALLEV